MKNCRQCRSSFEVSEQDLSFYKKVSPEFAGKKYLIPPPTLCPDCRQQRRLAFRNERKLYNRKSDLSGKDIVSIYSPDSPYKVYDQEEWWGDRWDGLDYGIDFDFSKTLSEQLASLYRDVPHASLYNVNTENSYFTNYALNQKNCYLIFGAGNNEDCLYGKYIVDSKNVVDSLAVYSSELCYEGVASDNCYGCKYFLNSRNCKDCLMIEDCLACRDCIACFGLRSKQYCIFNKQYTRDEYEKLCLEYKSLSSGQVLDLRQKLDELKADSPHIQSHIYASENCSGDGIYNSKNCINCFESKNCENCKFMYFSPNCFETYDCSFCAPDGVRFCYNVCSTVDLESCMTAFFVWYGHDIYYSVDCHNSGNLFACVGLKSQSYCILNKKYSKEEYENLAAKIASHMIGTGEWGEYFPISISPFAYNETIAQEYFPLDEEEALSNGWRWREEKHEVPDVKKVIPAQRLPDSIEDVPDEILDWAIECEKTARPFRIIPQELKFYRSQGLPIPHLHPDERHKCRLSLRNPYKLWPDKCDKCSKEIESSYPPVSRTGSPDRPEKVYCEKCYLDDVY